MSWTDWLGVNERAPPPKTASSQEQGRNPVRAPQPKQKAITPQRGGAWNDDDVDPANLVPKIVVDFGDMSEPTVEPVYVHVYDVNMEAVKFFRSRNMSYNPFHTAVEVLGSETSFVWSVTSGEAEIISNPPRKNTDHKWRMTLAAGNTSRPPREIIRAVAAMEAEYNNNTFNWKSRNCHHYASALCVWLGVRRLPQWLSEDHVTSGPVFLRIYNLGQTFLTRGYNSVTRDYGAYHTGVEVYGREWAFGVPAVEGEGFEGNYCDAVNYCSPGECPEHDFREAIYMGSTSFTPKQVEAIIEEMRREWTGDQYDVFKKNCHNFSQAFCAKLGVAQPPAWINVLAEVLAPEDELQPRPPG